MKPEISTNSLESKSWPPTPNVAAEQYVPPSLAGTKIELYPSPSAAKSLRILTVAIVILNIITLIICVGGSFTVLGENHGLGAASRVISPIIYIFAALMCSMAVWICFRTASWISTQTKQIHKYSSQTPVFRLDSEGLMIVYSAGYELVIPWQDITRIAKVEGRMSFYVVVLNKFDAVPKKYHKYLYRDQRRNGRHLVILPSFYDTTQTDWNRDIAPILQSAGMPHP